MNKNKLNGSVKALGEAFGNVLTEALEPVNEKLDKLQKQSESTETNVNTLLEWITERDDPSSKPTTRR